jgi:hypothetical protein
VFTDQKLSYQIVKVLAAAEIGVPEPGTIIPFLRSTGRPIQPSKSEFRAGCEPRRACSPWPKNAATVASGADHRKRSQGGPGCDTDRDCYRMMRRRI